MTAILLQSLSDAGVQLTIGDTGKLKVSGDQSAVDRWLPDIRTHKPELIALLQGTCQGNQQPPPLTPDQQADIQEAIDERAAILEFEAGLPRPEAETQATSAMRVYRYRVTDKPNDWLVMIAPGCDLEEARRTLIARFGSERLLEVQIHRPEVRP